MPSYPPITKPGKQKLADAAARAFVDDPLTQWLIPDPTARLDRQSRYFRGAISFADRYARLYTRPELDAAALWYPPAAKRFRTWQLVRSGLIWAPLSLGVTGSKRMAALDRVTADLWKRYVPGPHWYLMFLFTDPPVQGQGIASALLKPGFEQADKDGLPCYVETMTVKDVAFYQKRGFEVAWEGVLPQDGPRMWTMLRRPGR